MRRQERISLRLPPSWIELLDQRRGGLPRTVFIRRLLQKSLQVPAVKDLRGHYDRLAAGIMCPSSVEKELKRRADVEKRRQARRVAKKRPKPAPPGPVFTFHASGQITSSDLDPLATFVGLVDDRGIYLPESHRYSINRVRAELLAAMEREPGQAWPERFQLFLERTAPAD